MKEETTPFGRGSYRNPVSLVPCTFWLLLGPAPQKNYKSINEMISHSDEFCTPLNYFKNSNKLNEKVPAQCTMKDGQL